MQEAEFWIFALKVRYRAFKVKPEDGHLTALVTSDHYHIYRLCSYGQGQLTLVTLIAQGQSQGHQGQWRFLADLYVFHKKLLYAEFKFVAIYYGLLWPQIPYP